MNLLALNKRIAGIFKFCYGIFLQLSQARGMSFELHFWDFVSQRGKQNFHLTLSDVYDIFSTVLLS